jgi:hypothetical protein
VWNAARYLRKQYEREPLCNRVEILSLYEALVILACSYNAILGV